MMQHIAATLEEGMPVLGMVILGVDVNVMTYPYDIMAYLPGHAPGAPDIERVMAAQAQP
jgi:hypothetical protein